LDNYEFKYLLPGKYLFRFIKDKNGNKKWDTGNYLKKIQPERVFYSSDTIELRANWDINYQLKIPAEEEGFFLQDTLNIQEKRQSLPALESLEISN
jgi:hypothetical protein